MFKKICAVSLLLLLSCMMSLNYLRADDMNKKIKITIGDKVLTAIMNNSEASKDFMSLFPLELTLTDYANTEKISYLSKKLSTKKSDDKPNPSAGSITLYAPWGNLAIFYKDFRSSDDLIIMGKIEGNIDVLKGSGPLKAKFEMAD